MGYRDYELLLSSSQTVSSDADSDYYLDTELTSPFWNRGLPPAVVLSVETAPGGTTGVNILLCHHTGEPTNTHVFLTAKILNADLVAGDQVVIPFPQGISLLRYFRIYYDLISGDETSFVVTAYVSPLPLYDSQ